MSLTRDIHTIEVAGQTVTVTGKTGPIHATWILLVDDVEQDRAAAAGDFTLRGALADGSPVEASVHQSLLGPTRVTIRHGDHEFDTTRGYVA